MKYAFRDGGTGVRLRWQVLIFAVAVLVFLYFTGQLTAPYLAGDDWPSLLPASQQGGVALAWTNTLAEGRWINYLWYLVSVHLTATSGNALFTAVYIALSCALAAVVRSNGAFLLCAFAMFFSPMFAELSLWPITGIGGAVLCTLALLALVRFGDRATLPVLFLATFVLVMAYPPLASIVLVAAATKQEKPTLKSSVILAVIFLLAFALSVLSIYYLNWQFHGYFGVKAARWRDPHSLRSIADLGDNLGIAAASWHQIWREYTLPIVCAGAASVALLLSGRSRARALAVVLAFVVCWCVTVGITAIAGVPEPGRSVPWLWVATCFLCALLATHDTTVYRYAGMALLALLGISGGLFAWRNYRSYRPVVAYIAEVGRAVHGYRDGVDNTAMALAGSLSDVPMAWPGGHWPEPGLNWIMWKRYGVTLHRCDYATCSAVQAYASTHDLHYPTVVRLDADPVLVLDRHAPEAILRNYPSIRQESALHLGYPVFLRYTSDMVRVTPFFPGTSVVPVSIALPPKTAGYSLHSASSACAYPVDYEVTDVNGKRVEAGRYETPQTITIDRSNRKAGFRLLSLSMAAGAKNNFSCNIVIAANP